MLLVNVGSQWKNCGSELEAARLITLSSSPCNVDSVQVFVMQPSQKQNSDTYFWSLVAKLIVKFNSICFLLMQH